MARLSRGGLARDSLERFGAFVLARDEDEAISIANLIAPEHLHVSTAEPKRLLPRLYHAGAIFLGHYTPVAAGDYAAGPSHVLPTGGTARWASGLSANDFLKRSSLISLRATGCDAWRRTSGCWRIKEGLTGHRLSVDLRLEDDRPTRIEFMKNRRGQIGAESPRAGRSGAVSRSGWPVLKMPRRLRTWSVSWRVYVKLEQHAKATPEDFRRHLFGPRPAAEAALAEVDGEAGRLRALVLDVFDVPRPARALSRRHLRRSRATVAAGSAKRCWPPWQRRPSSAGADGWNGLCSTGTRRPSAFTLARGAAHGRVDGLPDR